MKFPFNLFEPLLVPFIGMAIEQGFAAIPDNVKPFLAVGVSSLGSELVGWAESTPTALDDAAVAKLKSEVNEYLGTKDCPNLAVELDRLFAV